MPRATGINTHLSRYENAWEAINRLIRQGGSWSGFERNCLYRATAPGSFTNASAVAGIDFADDGRSVAVWDFDRDGDPDLLLKNRSAPQLRMLRNNSSSTHSRVSIRLRGTRSNRDAIGARVRFETDDRIRVKELRAGSAFLSQSSRELLFGIGTASSIDRLVVRWPSGEEQVFEDVAAGFSYVIREGDPVMSKSAFAESRLPTEATPPAPKRATTAAPRRPWLIEPPRLPSLELRSLDGRPAGLSSLGREPFVLALWSPGCPVCVRELTGWDRARSSEVRTKLAEIPVYALAGAPEPDERAVFERWSTKLDVPLLFADPRELLVLSILIEDLVWWRRDLPLPCSLLIDGKGRIARLYEGAVEWSQVRRDVERLPGGPAERLRLALPFPGVYHASNISRNEFQLGVSLLEAGLPRRAIDVFQQALSRRPDDVETLYNLGLIHLGAGDLENARATLERAVRGAPDFVDAIVNLGVVEAREGRLDVASQRFEAALRLRPDHVEALMNLGNTELAGGRPRAAIERFRRVAQLEKTWAVAHQRIGTALRALGDLPAAIRAYETAGSIEPRNPEVWSNLAVLFAESGDLDRGHRACERAMTVAPLYAPAYVNDGLILAALGRSKDAEASFRRAIELEPRSPAGYLQLARHLLSSDRVEEARQVLREVLGVAPGHPLATELLRSIEAE